jgi:hypothetical protein
MPVISATQEADGRILSSRLAEAKSARPTLKDKIQIEGLGCGSSSRALAYPMFIHQKSKNEERKGRGGEGRRSGKVFGAGAKTWSWMEQNRMG